MKTNFKFISLIIFNQMGARGGGETRVFTLNSLKCDTLASKVNE